MNIRSKLGKIKRTVKSRVKNLRRLNLRYFFKHKDQLGLTFPAFVKLRIFDQYEQVSKRTQFFDKPLEMPSPFWFLHSVDEIFVQEVYKFCAESKKTTIIDCGANIGLSVMYFNKFYPGSKIIAFEPDPGIYKILKNNILPHGINGNAQIINAAVWTKKDTLSFGSEGSVGGRLDFEHSHKESVQIPTVRLKDYLTEQIDFLKIDIEGAEYDVLKDCRDLLVNVTNLFIEYHVMPNEEQHLDEILQWVKEAGFKYYINEAWKNMSHPFTKVYDDHFQMQLNISCYR